MARFEAFKSWGRRDVTYKSIFKKLNESTFCIITDALTEIEIAKPGMYDFWWANNHIRYNDVKDEQKRITHELMYHFLTKYARGELIGKKHSNRKTAAI